MTSAEADAAQHAHELMVLRTLADGTRVVVEAGWAWANNQMLTSSDTVDTLAALGLVVEVGTHLHITSAGRDWLAHHTEATR